MTKIMKERSYGSVTYSTLQEVVNAANEIMKSIKDGPKRLEDFFFELEHGYYDDVSCLLKYGSLETDDEYAYRMKNEQNENARREALERRQYEALKKKYEK